MALDVSDDSKVLNIDMVHANIMQVDITMEDMKEEESVRWKWIKSNDWRDVDYNCPETVPRLITRVWMAHDIKVLNTLVHSSRPGVDTKEMQNYTGEKSILAVFEEILLKSSCEHSKLLKDKTKVTEGGGKTLQ